MFLLASADGFPHPLHCCGGHLAPGAWLTIVANSCSGQRPLAAAEKEFLNAVNLATLSVLLLLCAVRTLLLVRFRRVLGRTVLHA